MAVECAELVFVLGIQLGWLFDWAKQLIEAMGVNKCSAGCFENGSVSED